VTVVPEHRGLFALVLETLCAMFAVQMMYTTERHNAYHRTSQATLISAQRTRFAHFLGFFHLYTNKKSATRRIFHLVYAGACRGWMAPGARNKFDTTMFEPEVLFIDRMQCDGFL